MLHFSTCYVIIFLINSKGRGRPRGRYRKREKQEDEELMAEDRKDGAVLVHFEKTPSCKYHNFFVPCYWTAP